MTRKSYEKFCSFCFHSKRPEEEFSSHWVKSKKDGKVTCPLLLANTCGYCKEKGHTPKHCPRLASREQRRQEHDLRFANRCPMRGLTQVQEQIHQKEETAAQQKRARIRCNDNQYAALMGAKHFKGRKKIQRTKPNGPKAITPPAPQGVWGKAAKTAAAVKNMTAGEVEQLKLLLSQMGIMNKPDEHKPDEQAWLDAEIAKNSQIDEETAEGEAFFDNDSDVEEAVTAIEAPILVRQGAFGEAGGNSAPMPMPAMPAAVPLPDSCNLDEDLAGEEGNWAQ